MDYFVGQILQFPYYFAPEGWTLCDGKTIEIRSHEALFSLLGTNFGGDGHNTFGIPDLRPRDEHGNIMFEIKLGDMYQGKPYIPYYIAIDGVYPPRD